MDMLEEKTHLPAVLQSLGCIAQTAMSVFETRESEIEGFIKRKVLECTNVGHPNSAGFLQPMINSLFFQSKEYFFYFRKWKIKKAKVGMTEANFVLWRSFCGSLYMLFWNYMISFKLDYNILGFYSV